MKRSLVIGAGGFLGSHLAEHLKRVGYQVSTDVHRDGSRLSLNDRESLDSIALDADVIYFMAGYTGVGDSFKYYKRSLLSNQLILLDFVNQLIETGSKARIVYPSTRLVYAGSSQPLNEDAAKKPKSPYAVNKLACEALLDVYSTVYGLKSSVIRIGVPYGGTDPSYGTIGFMMKQVQKSGVISIYGSGQQERTFTHIDDISSMLELIGGADDTTYSIYNLPGETLSLRNVANMIANRFSGTVRHTEWPEFANSVESGSTIFDSSKFILRFGYKSKHMLANWISECSDFTAFLKANII